MVSSTDQETNEIESQEPKLRSPEIQQSEKSEEIAPDVIEPQPNRSDGEGKSRPLTSPRDHLVGSGEEELPTPSLSMKGWRLYVLTFGLCLSLLLSTLETTIVSTSLVSITNDLHGFENRDWVVTSYLLTYTGFLVIYAKFSDIFGNKFMMLLALLIFTVFSIACGAATGIVELIILRAFQGIGGSGIYSMVSVVSVAVLPPAKFGKYMAIISSVLAIASVLGPLLGGAINDNSSWRWVFLLNAPAGAAATAMIIIFLPSDYSSQNTSIFSRLRNRFTLPSFRRLDLIGVFFMLAASILLVFSLEEVGSRYSWKSVPIILTLVIAVLSWVAFAVWEIWLEKNEKVQEPIFPMRLFGSRIFVGMMLNAFFTGFPFTSIVVNIPQRFQAVNSSSPTRAGLLLLPLLLVSPFASGLTGFLVTKARIPPFYLVFIGSALQIIGVGLTSSLSPNPHRIEPATYGYEVIMGFGFGLTLTTLITMVPLVVSKKDMAVSLGAITQIRVLGGTIGLAISTTVLNSFVRNGLEGMMLSVEQIEGINTDLSYIKQLTETQQVAVRTVFANGYNKQTKVLLGFCGLMFLSSLLMWERNPRRVVVEEIEDGQTAMRDKT